MEINSQQNNGVQYKKPGFWKSAGGIVAGGTVTNLVSTASLPLGLYCVGKMSNINASAKDSFEVINQAADKMLKDSGLEKAGVKIIDAGTKDFYDKYVKITDEIFGNVPKKVKDVLNSLNPFAAAYNGKNAFFNPKTSPIIKEFMNIEDNAVYVAKNKLPLATFHELGHAINYNSSKIGKALQGMRYPAMALAGLLGAIALFKAPKAEGEKPKGFFDKATTFIKNNVGKLTFIAMVPMIIEEGLASGRAAKWAKKLLSPELAKKVNKVNALGFATYVGGAAVAGIAAWAGTKVRDKIAHKTPIEKKFMPNACQAHQA